MSAVETADHKAGGRSRATLWRDVGGLLKEFWAAHPLASLGMIVVLLIGNASLGLLVTSMGGAVDGLTGTRGSGASRGHSVLFWLAVYVIASALGEFYWSFKNLIRDYLRDQGAYRIQRRVLARAAAAPLIQFEEGAFFEHLQRATNGMGERLAGVYGQLVDLGQLLVLFGSIAVALYVIQPVLVPLLIAGTLPSIWLQARVATAGYQAQRAHATRDRIRAHLQSLLTGRDAAAEVRLFGTADYLLTYWRRLRAERSRDVLGAEQQQATSTTLGSVASGIAYAAALVLVAFLILRGRLSIGNYVTVAAGALSFDGLLATFVGSVRSLEEQSQFLGDLFDFWRVARDEGEAGRWKRTQSPSPIREPRDRCCVMSAWASHGASALPSLVRMAPARPRWPSYWSASISRTPAACCWMARRSRKVEPSRSAGVSPRSSRTTPASSSRCARTSASVM